MSRAQSDYQEPHALTEQEFEKIRLLLSVYQDGFGMQALKDGLSLPGWRDFERVVAVALNGLPPRGEGKEGKHIFDVIVPIGNSHFKGISCKMRSELNRVIHGDGRVTIELTNSSGEFWKYLAKRNISVLNYREKSSDVGEAIIDLVTSWHVRDSITGRNVIHLDESFYLVLSWNENNSYQLHQFALTLPDPKSLVWDAPLRRQKGEMKPGRRICGRDSEGSIVLEWYGESGGQLKYYPLAAKAVWQSRVFNLEPLPLSLEYGLLAKVKAYFPVQWEMASRDM